MDVPASIILVGDINFHLDDAHDRGASQMLDILNIAGMKQYLKKPTHKAGHTLDMLVTRERDKSYQVILRSTILVLSTIMENLQATILQ